MEISKAKIIQNLKTKYVMTSATLTLKRSLNFV